MYEDGDVTSRLSISKPRQGNEIHIKNPVKHH